MRIVALTSAILTSAFLIGCDNEPNLAQQNDTATMQVNGPAQVDDRLGQSSNEVPAPASGPSNPALQTTEGNTAAAPVVGANSFTQGEAEAHIEARGFADVGDLVLDDNGIWRGTATLNGTPVQVALDFQGNIFSE